MPKNPYQTYFKDIASSDGDGTEFTYRTYFQNLLNEIKLDKDIKIIQEPKKDEQIIGRPDFKVEQNGLVIGYIETKPLGMNLDEIIDGNTSRESIQLKQYLKVIPNLILTNYNEFILFKNQIPVDRGILFYPSTDKRLNRSNIPNIERIIKSFFSYSPQLITTPKKLSSLLAERTILFRDYLTELLESERDSNFKDSLLGLKEVIEETLIQDFSLNDFIDAYAQTITYGLFLAEINSKADIKEDTAYKFIPESIGILRELFKTIHIEDIPDSIAWILEEIINILNNTDNTKLKNKLSFSQFYQYEDPYVYFYENFLSEYDKIKRKYRGVYYTPIPVVNFIIDSIDYLLKTNFNNEGLKGEDIKVLDFATGTGTFLLEAFKKALEGTDKGMVNNLIKERLLKNYYGFEYLIAPYSIAHLKLSQFLGENGYTLEDDERLKVYLTDTLDNSTHKGLLYFSKITKEGHEANLIKIKENILVMMGNPPYSNYSSGVVKEGYQWIKNLLNDYKEGLNETKINIDDDYIKFLRYAQWKIDKNGFGVVGVITNNSYLDGITHRIMRKSLLNTFDEIYILNLHGNKRRLETDENVFDVMVGVNIALFVKFKEPKEKKVYYYSTMDNKIPDRETKYSVLLANDVSTMPWTEIKPVEPDYWFINKELDLEEEYMKGWKLTDIFKEYVSGIESQKDDFSIHYKKKDLRLTLEDLINLDVEKIRFKYNLGDDGRDWTINDAKIKVQEDINQLINKQIISSKDLIKEDWNKIDELRLKKLHYRPFDYRYTFYQNKSKGFLAYPRFKIMKYLLIKDNLGLVSVRQVAEKKGFNHAFITEDIADRRLTTSNRGACYVFPLFIGDDTEKYSNFTEKFTKYLKSLYKTVPSPNDILGYIYSILNSNIYRQKYNEYLKIDYPVVSFTKDYERFKLLSNLGSKLIKAHLLKNDYFDSKLALFLVEGDNKVNKIVYDNKSSKLYINNEQYFDNVPKEVWELEIGGYQVLKKWLQYRKKNEVILSFNDISHFQKVVRALNETISIIDEIDQVYKKLDF